MNFLRNLLSFFRNLFKKQKPEKVSVLEDQDSLISEGDQEDEQSQDTYIEVSVEEEQIGKDMKNVPGFQPMMRTTTVRREYNNKSGKLLSTTTTTVIAGNVAPSEPNKDDREQAAQNDEKQLPKQSPIVEAIRRNARNFSQEIYENDRDGKSNDKFQGEKPANQAREMMLGLRNSSSENALDAKAVVGHLIGNLICVNKEAKEIFGADPDFAKFATDALENAQTQGQKINLMHGLNAFASCAKEDNQLTQGQRELMGEKALEMAKDPQKLNEQQKATIAMGLLNGQFEPTKEAMGIVQAFSDSIQGEGKFQNQSNNALGKIIDRMRAKQETQPQENELENQEDIYEQPDPEQPARFDEQQAARQKMLQDVADANEYETVDLDDESVYEVSDPNGPALYEAAKAQQKGQGKDTYEEPSKAAMAEYDALKAETQQQNGSKYEEVDEHGYPINGDANLYEEVEEKDQEQSPPYSKASQENRQAQGQGPSYTKASQEKDLVQAGGEKEDEGQGTEEAIYDSYQALEEKMRQKQQQKTGNTIAREEDKDKNKTPENAYNNGPNDRELEDEGVEEDGAEQEEQQQSGQKAWLNDIIKAGPKKQGSFSKGREADAKLSHVERASVRETQRDEGIVNDGH